MQSLSGGDRPQKNFIAAAVAQRMASMQQTDALKASSSPSPQPPQQLSNLKRKRDEVTRNDVTIDLTDDEEIDKALPTRNKLPRLISPQSPVEEQPQTPHKKSPRSPIESPHSPAKMAPGLLHSALNATSPKSPIESPRSPVEEATSRKSKVVKLKLAQAPEDGKYSPGSAVEEATSRKRKLVTLKLAENPDNSKYSPGSEDADIRNKRARRIIESPQSPVEEVNPYVAPAYAAVESPNSPVEVTDARIASSQANIESPRSLVEAVAPPFQVSSNATATATTTTTPPGTPPTTHPLIHNFSDATTTTTPPGTPPITQKPQNDITHTQVSDRFAPLTIDGVEYRNPAKFSINPPFWQRWDAKTYVKFAEHLRFHFDPTPFAKETGIPVEELTHVFNAVVCNPLYYPEEAAKRGEEGMTEVMELFQDEKWATVNRPWGKVEGKRWLAELKGVRKGGVELIMGRSGKSNLMGVNLLGKEDVKYLRENLREEDWKVLWG